MRLQPYENMSHQQRLEVWQMYKNACELAVTYQARTDPQVGAKRNDQVQRLYDGWIQYFTAEDIKD